MSGQFRSHRHYEQYSKANRYFEKVTEAYLEFRSYAPVVACQYDPEARSKKLVPTMIHFLSDVDIATKSVLKSEALLKQWQQLVLGENVPLDVAAHIVERCARIYRARHLAPFEYFAVAKKPLQNAAAA